MVLTHLKKQSNGPPYGTYSDIYKDAHGFNSSTLEYTIEKLEQMIDDVSDEAKEIAKWNEEKKTCMGKS